MTGRQVGVDTATRMLERATALNDQAAIRAALREVR
jgi:hypothetical protein